MLLNSIKPGSINSLLRQITSRRFKKFVSSNRIKFQNYPVIYPQYHFYELRTVNFSNEQKITPGELSSFDFETVSEDTLESLNDYFDELIEQTNHLSKADVSYGDGVLTVQFGDPYGTYVINRQSPNKQIWLSSPTSGPKRYDFVNDRWIYKHNGQSLHELLDTEIPSIINSKSSFNKCSYGGG